MSTTARTGTSRGRAFTTDARPPEPGAVSPGGQEVAKAATTAVAASDYAEDAGDGMEGVESSELLIPFVRMLQGLSPQCVEGSPAYDPDVRPGMILHTATGESFPRDVGVGFIPCYRDSSFTEWVPLLPEGGSAGGGGFRGTWAHDDPRIAKMKVEQGAFKKLKTADGNELVETYTIVGVVVPRDKDGRWRVDEATNGVISFTSTQIKKYRQMLTRLQALIGTPPKFPMYAWRWNLGSQPEKNKYGSYYGWRLTLDGESSSAALLNPKTDVLYQLARELYQLMKSGAAKADFSGSDVGSETAGASGTGGPIDQGGDPGASAEEIPF